MKTIGEKWEILKPVYFWVFWISIILMPFLGGNNSKRSKTKTNPNKPERLDQVTVSQFKSLKNKKNK